MFEEFEAAEKEREKSAPEKLKKFHFDAMEDVVRRCGTWRF